MGEIRAAELADDDGFAMTSPLQARLGAPLAGSESAIVDPTIAYEIPGDITTDETIAVGEVRLDTLEVVGDEDWFALTLADGESVEIELTGTGESPLLDAHLWLYDSAGTLIDYDDDGGPGLGSLIEFTTPAAGTFLVAAASYGGLYAGDYRLAVTPVLPQADTIPASTATQASIALGGTVTERIDYFGDADWFRLSLADGQAALLEVAGSGEDPLYDPVLRVYDVAGRLVQEFDDGSSYASSHRFVAPADGTFFLEVASYGNETVGDYTLSATETDPPRLIDSVRGVTRVDTADPVLVYLAQAGDTFTQQGTTYTASGFNAYESGRLASVLDGIEVFADIDFQLTTDRAAADIEWGSADLGASLLGFFSFPNAAGEGGSGLLNNTARGWRSSLGGGLDAGGIMYGTAIHEFGHALGLAHTHDTGNVTVVMNGVAASTDLGDFELNQTVFSVMSYNDGWRSNPDGRPGTYNYGYARTCGAIDIAALQEMYGANQTANAGDDVYALAGANGSGVGYATVWDTGGIDEIRYEGATGAVLDLRSATLGYEEGGGGFISRVVGVFGGLTIANGAIVEKATAGGGDDVLTGNAADNVLRGGAGADTLDGGDGDDTLEGGTGDDLLTGGGGADLFRFGPEDGADSILDFEIGLDVIDMIETGATFDDLAISDGTDGAVIAYPATTATTTTRIELVGIAAALLSETSFLTADPATSPVGTAASDTLIGTSGDDELLGLEGDDTLEGRAGADTLNGGPGVDTASYARAPKAVTLALAAGGTAGDAAGDSFLDIENVLGSAHDDRITGDDAANRIEGGGGADILKGAGGADELDGGAGDDRLWGGAGADLLLGGDGQDFLWGGSGDDVLDAGATPGGRQYLYGEAGSDTYRYDRAAGDIVITTAGEGPAPDDHDRIVFADLGVAELDFSTSPSSSQGTLLVIGWDDGTGQGTVLVAEEGRFIESYEFADGTAFGSVIVAPSSGGTTRGGAGDELLLGGDGQDFLWGGAGDDLLDAGVTPGGRQYLYGQAGSDTYRYDRAAGDIVITTAGEGSAPDDHDRLVFADLGVAELDFSTSPSSSQGTLLMIGWGDGDAHGTVLVAEEGRFIESYELADGTAFGAVVVAPSSGGTTKGGAGDELLVGGDGQDFLWGGSGDDLLDAGATPGGRQYLYGQAGSDTYRYDRAAGDIVITTAGEGSAPDDHDRLVFADLGVADLEFTTSPSSSQGTLLMIGWNDFAGHGSVLVAEEGQFIESYEFADGSVLTSGDLLALV